MPTLKLFLAVLCGVCGVCGGAAAPGPRQVRWYLNGGLGDANAAFVDGHRDAITGAYLCCNIFHVAANGSWAGRSDEWVKSNSQPLVSRGVDVWLVVGVSQAAVQNGTAAAAVPAAVAAAVRLNVTGFMVDYEPASNYTMGHVMAYASFLKHLAAGLHASGRKLGVDVATWYV